MAGAPPGAGRAHRGGRRGARRPGRGRRRAHGRRPGLGPRGPLRPAARPLAPPARPARGRPPRDGGLARRAALRGRRLPRAQRGVARRSTAPGCCSTGAGGSSRGCPSRAPRAARRSSATASTWSAARPRRPPRRLAARSLQLDLRTLRWQGFAGIPRPREHLGVTALGGRVYAIGGRTGGLETNTAAADAYDPRTRAWYAPARRPHPARRQRGHRGRRPGRRRGRRGARRDDPAGQRLRPGGRRVAAACRRARGPVTGWPSSGIGRTVYQALGGPEPGLTVSRTLLSLRVPARS